MVKRQDQPSPTRVGGGCERTSTTGALRQGAGLEYIPDRL